MAGISQGHGTHGGSQDRLVTTAGATEQCPCARWQDDPQVLAARPTSVSAPAVTPDPPGDPLLVP